jgi:hypothetical protein
MATPLGLGLSQVASRLIESQAFLPQILRERRGVELDHPLPALDEGSFLFDPADGGLPGRNARDDQVGRADGDELAGQEESVLETAPMHGQIVRSVRDLSRAHSIRAAGGAPDARE